MSSALPAYDVADVVTVPHQDKTKSEKYDYDEKVPEGPAVEVTSADHEDEYAPTTEELHTLRKIPAGMPLVAILMCAVEFTERASYYGTSGPFNNFINNKLPVGGNGAGAVAPGDLGLNQSAGALGLGSVPASALTKMFTFLAYVIPIWGGIVADNKWGRFKTICVGTAIGAIAHVILVIPAIPQVIAVPNASLGTFIVSIIILAFAAGFIKPSLGPMLCDQSPIKTPMIKYTKKGEKVIVDPQATISRYLLIFYLCINVGSLVGQLATQYSARFVGFWLAFLVPGIMYMALPPLLWWASPRLVKLPPQGTVVPDAMRVVKICLSNGGWRKLGRGDDAWWGKANPDQVLARGEAAPAWDAQFVEEVRQTFSACAVFFIIPVFILADGGIGNALNDMSVAMTLNGVPNDLLNNFNPLAIIIFGPIITYGLYPFMERIGHPIKPMMRMSIGFILASLGCVSAAVLQDRIYKTSPCLEFASTCDDVSPVSLWWQVLPYFLPAVGELFVNVTSYELAYTRSPPRMKGLVYSMALFNSAIGAAISMALSKVIEDPNLTWTWVALAVASAACAPLFPLYWGHLDHFDFAWSEEEKNAIKDGEQKKLEALKDEEKY